MADEGRGYRVILKLNQPPRANYESGNSLILQGDTVGEVASLVQSLIPDAEDGVGGTVLQGFAERGLLGSVEQILAREKSSGAVGEAVEAGGNPATTPADPAPTGDKPASAGLLKLVAQKTGKSVDELGELTEEQAKTLLKEAK